MRELREKFLGSADEESKLGARPGFRRWNGVKLTRTCSWKLINGRFNMLRKGSSRKTMANNYKKLKAEGKPKSQRIAIMLKEAGKSKSRLGSGVTAKPKTKPKRRR